MSEHVYTVRWSDKFGLYEGRGLTPRKVMALLRMALRDSDRGPITVYTAERTEQA